MTMPPGRLPRLCRPFAPLLVLLVGLLCALGAARVDAAVRADDPRSVVSFESPDPDLVRAEVRDILADPRFAPRRSFIEILFGWLRDRLSGLRTPSLGGMGGVMAWLVWILIIWCVLTLVAIFAHFIWTVVVLLRKRRSPSSAFVSSPEHFARVQSMSFEGLCEMIAQLAREGAYRDAIGVMMVALTRWLDGAGVLRFHQSKTNGDYLREFSRESPGREDFRRFVFASDAAVYSGVPCEPEVFQNMNAMFENVRSKINEKS